MKKDFFTWNLDRVDGWIKNADTKASVLLAFDGALLALIAGTLEHIIVPAKLQLIVFGTFTVLLVAAIYSGIEAALSLLPRTKSDSVLFFGRVAKMSQEKYWKVTSAWDDKSLSRQLSNQAHTNSIIASKKFSHLRRGWRSLLVAAVATALYVSLLFVGNATSKGQDVVVLKEELSAQQEQLAVIETKLGEDRSLDSLLMTMRDITDLLTNFMKAK